MHLLSPSSQHLLSPRQLSAPVSARAVPVAVSMEQMSVERAVELPVELPAAVSMEQMSVELPAAVERSAAVQRSAAVERSVEPVAVAVLIPSEVAAMVAPATLPRPTPMVLRLPSHPTECTADRG